MVLGRPVGVVVVRALGGAVVPPVAKAGVAVLAAGVVARAVRVADAAGPAVVAMVAAAVMAVAVARSRTARGRISSRT